MKKTLCFLCFLFALLTSKAQVEAITKPIIVDAACGQCQFNLKTQKGCDLAIQLKGTSYFVDSTKIDDHGDAHAKDGFCNAIRKASVTGTIVNNRFVATSFKLLTPEEIIALKPKRKGKG